MKIIQTIAVVFFAFYACILSAGAYLLYTHSAYVIEHRMNCNAWPICALFGGMSAYLALHFYLILKGKL